LPNIITTFITKLIRHWYTDLVAAKISEKIKLGFLEDCAMGKRIKIKARTIEVIAELNDTKTAQAIWDALPIKGFANLWGDEIYFSIPVIIPPESGKEVVNLGDLGYWHEGNAFCIFFGLTPISKGKEIKPASAVNVFGKVIGDATVFKKVSSGTKIVVEQASDEKYEPQSKSLLIPQTRDLLSPEKPSLPMNINN
jgi:hypothetical protein